MNFNQEKKENYTLVTSSVEKFDASNASEVKAIFLLLNKDSVNNIVFDLSNTKYCDSSGLSAILIGNRLCKDSGGQFVVSGLQPKVYKLIQISQLDTVLNIVDSSADAAKLFSA